MGLLGGLGDGSVELGGMLGDEEWFGELGDIDVHSMGEGDVGRVARGELGGVAFAGVLIGVVGGGEVVSSRQGGFFEDHLCLLDSATIDYRLLLSALTAAGCSFT